MNLFNSLPDSVKEALLGLVLTNIAALSVALQQFIKAKFYRGAFSNTVEAIHQEGCFECAAKVRILNQADGIEDKVKPVVQAIKAADDAKKEGS